jgi:hypothetical protein
MIDLARIRRRTDELQQRLRARLIPLLERGLEFLRGDEPEPMDLDDTLLDEAFAEADDGAGALPDFEIQRSLPLQERLVDFAENVRGATGSYAAFVADSQGLPLVSRNTSDEYIALSAEIDRALAPIRATLHSDPHGSASLEIDDNNVLQLIWANTPQGRYGIGLILPESLAGEFLHSIRAQLNTLLADTQGTAA